MPLSTGAPRKIFSPHNMGHKFAAVDQENFHLLASLPFFQDLPMEKLASIMLTLKHRKVKMLPAFPHSARHASNVPTMKSEENYSTTPVVPIRVTLPRPAHTISSFYQLDSAL
jgi:hypothetical protein